MRLGDPDQLALIMATDPYFVTQDNGAGAPLHFATTYKQLDMVRLRCRLSRAPPCRVTCNQPDVMAVYTMLTASQPEKKASDHSSTLIDVQT